MELRPRESLSATELREHQVLEGLLSRIPGLRARISGNPDDDDDDDDDDHRLVASLIQKGVSAARSDDTKGLKGAVIDWITPGWRTPESPLHRNTKTDRGFNHDCTGHLLCPVELDWTDPSTKEQLRLGEIQLSGEQWSHFLYQNYTFNPANPWEGLFRSELLVNGYKFIFTSPSSVENEPKATRSGNARIHDMKKVTLPSLAYVATQVWFALTSAATFSQLGVANYAEDLYNSIIELLEDPEELEHVSSLLAWWNQCVILPS
ncbi:hypothetical protein PHLCEN_2v3796 [Hermanssonia centrifuga]|uniref:Uncharacterized protein n=1 Tax=Hermanssonia centrifuga TaxID=98765 RepID=A0A2R6QBM5_9APHY|nr:hypothetical protein PHLCEN_2v3796 [Hermanssonia centrifuga]